MQKKPKNQRKIENRIRKNLKKRKLKLKKEKERKRKY